MYSGGNGTLAEPYLIANLQDLNDIVNNPTAHFKQTTDISIGNNFAPINCTFTGSYNGNFNYIWNGMISYPDNDNIGLFKNTDGIFLNMFFSNITVQAKNYGGMIAGLVDNAVNFYAYNVHLSDTCEILGGSGNCHGGIVGYLSCTTSSIGKIRIERCSSKAPVSSYDSNIGGIAGKVINCSISNCSFESYATTSVGNIGGIAGYFEGDSTCKLQFCCNKGEYIEISNEYAGGDYAGGIVGQAVGTPTIIRCYALNQYIKVDNISAINCGRVIGNNTTNDNYNYALDTMYFQDSQPTP